MFAHDDWLQVMYCAELNVIMSFEMLRGLPQQKGFMQLSTPASVISNTELTCL
jgi:hypothetical protein